VLALEKKNEYANTAEAVGNRMNVVLKSKRQYRLKSSPFKRPFEKVAHKEQLS
jgi:hypothetical protein